MKKKMTMTMTMTLTRGMWGVNPDDDGDEDDWR